MLDHIPLSRNSDIERFLGIYKKLIKDKVIKSTSSYMETRNNINLIAEEEKEAEEQKNEKKREKKGRKKGKKSEPTFEELQNQILAKKTKSSNDFLSNLAGKYCDPNDGPIGEMPSEEEFQRARKGLKKKTTAKGKTKAKAKGKKGGKKL